MATSTATIKLRRPLTPKVPYRVRAIGIRGLLGRTGNSDRPFHQPALRLRRETSGGASPLRLLQSRMTDPRRDLPSVNALLEKAGVRSLLEQHPRRVVLEAVEVP